MSGLLDQLKAASTDAKAPAAREGAFVAYAELAAGAPRLAEPYLVPMLPTILDKCSDKVCAALSGVCSDQRLIAEFTGSVRHTVISVQC